MHLKHQIQSGFTLIELMVTIAIAAILLGMAIPSFTNAIAGNRLTTAANELVTALNLARSEAVKRGVTVSVRRTAAAASVWEGGWQVFTDINGNGTLNDNGDANPCEAGEDCLLRQFDALAGGLTLRTGGNFACAVGFLPSGGTTGFGNSCNSGLGNDTFRLCDISLSTATSRSIVVTATGRTRVENGTAACP